MTNKGTRSRNCRKPKLRLLDLTFDKPVLDEFQNGKRPHGGVRGKKAHPMSQYSFNRSSEYQNQMNEEINRLFHEEFIQGRASPAWAFDISKEITHSGESPFYVHGLLSSSRVGSESSLIHAQKRSTTPVSTTHNTPRKRATSYYRSNTPHSYLTAIDPQTLSKSELKYGRPTRTTLLRARQRCASAPVNSYEVRREIMKKSENQASQAPVNKEVLPSSVDGESPHAFLTGARYNRAHFLDAKGLSVYGVYMPRTNPQALFMTGHATQKSRDKGQSVPSVPPDSPRSDIEENSPTEKRPSTAPGKRLLSSPMHGRPLSAWGEHSTSVTILHRDNQKVMVTFKTSKPKNGYDSVLPTVTGKTAPKMYYRKQRDYSEDTVNQPPPTPTSAFSLKDGSDKENPSETLEKSLEKIKEVQSDNESETQIKDNTDTDNRAEETVVNIDSNIGTEKIELDKNEPGESCEAKTEIIDESEKSAKDLAEESPSSEDHTGQQSTNKSNELQTTETDVKEAVLGESTQVAPNLSNTLTVKSVALSSGESLYKTNSSIAPPQTPRDINSDEPVTKSTNSEVSADNKNVVPEFFLTKDKNECQMDTSVEGKDLPEGVTSIQVTIVDKSLEKSS